MKSISISQFKAQALGIIDQVSKSREGILINKRGKAIARVIPIEMDPQKPVPGKLKDTLIDEIDIISPLGSKLWKSAR